MFIPLNVKIYLHVAEQFNVLQVDETLDLFDDLQLQHQAVATKTKTLHDACDRLVCPSILLD